MSHKSRHRKSFSWLVSLTGCSVNLEGWGGWGRRSRRDRPYVDLWLIHIVVWMKLAQYCKAIILQGFFKPIHTHDIILYILVVQSLCHVQLSMTPWTAAHQASLSYTFSQSLLKFMSIASVMPSNHLIPYHPLLLLPSIFPASGSFQRLSSSHQVAKVLELQLQHQAFQWIFRIDFI